MLPYFERTVQVLKVCESHTPCSDLLTSPSSSHPGVRLSPLPSGHSHSAGTGSGSVWQLMAAVCILPQLFLHPPSSPSPPPSLPPFLPPSPCTLLFSFLLSPLLCRHTGNTGQNYQQGELQASVSGVRFHGNSELEKETQAALTSAPPPVQVLMQSGDPDLRRSVLVGGPPTSLSPLSPFTLHPHPFTHSPSHPLILSPSPLPFPLQPVSLPTLQVWHAGISVLCAAGGAGRAARHHCGEDDTGPAVRGGSYGRP